MLLPTKCSLQASLADLKQVACASFGLEEVDVQMFDYFTRKKYAAEPLDVKPDETIEGANLLDNQDILLEEKVSWPVPESLFLPTRAYTAEQADSVPARWMANGRIPSPRLHPPLHCPCSALATPQPTASCLAAGQRTLL